MFVFVRNAIPVKGLALSSLESSCSPSEITKVTESDSGNSPSLLQSLPVAGQREAPSSPRRLSTVPMPGHPTKPQQPEKAAGTVEDSSVPGACSNPELKMRERKAEQERSEGKKKCEHKPEEERSQEIFNLMHSQSPWLS